MFSKFSVKKPYTVIVGIIIALVLGVISFTGMTTDLLPAMELPYMIVYTTYPGASAEKVEKNVTKVIESAVSTTSNLSNVTSTSSDNLSMVVLEFADDTNMDSAMIDVSGKLDSVSGYFDDAVSSPVIMALNPDMLPVIEVAIYGEGLTQAELADVYATDIEAQLEKIDGVASVTTIGALEESIEIKIDQSKIDELNDLLLKSIDEELWKAQKEIYDGYATIQENQQKLDDSKSELESGKNTLAQTQTTTINSLAEATTKLDDASGQLNALLAHEQELIIDRTALETEKAAITEAVTTTIPTAISSMTAAQSGIAAYYGMGGNPTDPIAGFTAVNPAIQTLVDTLTAQGFTINTVGDLDSALTTSITDLNNQLATLNTRLDEINTGLNNIATELLAASATKSSLSSQIQQLTSAKNQLEAGKMTATIELSKASSQLATGESALTSAQAQLDSARTQLDSAQDQLNDAKKDAYKQADIGGMITPAMISQILTAENFSMPAGTIVQGDNTHIVVKVGDEFSSIEELQNLTLFAMPDVEGLEQVKLSDIATVEFTDNSDSSYAKLNGNNGIIVVIEKQSTASTAEVCKSIRNELNDLSESIDGVGTTVLFDQGVYIDLIVDSVLNNLLQGGLLAILILLLFLKDWKPTLIIGISIPVSLLVAVVLMYFSGITLNVISLSGLALGVGMLVDNSIVVIENIYRLRHEGVPLIEATVKGAHSVSGAIIASTLTTICVFLPIVFATGIAKQLFVDMGLTIAYALLASLMIALTVVPMLSSKMLGKVKERKHPWFDAVSNAYSKLLNGALRVKWLVIGAVLALLIFSIYSVTIMGTSFMPDVDSTQLSLTLTMDNDLATKKETQEATDTLMERIMEMDGVDAVGAMQGASSLMSTSSDNSSDMYIILKDDHKYSSTQMGEMITDAASDLPVTLDVSTSNMNMSMISGSGIQIVLYGTDLDDMNAQAQEIKDSCINIEGISDIVIGSDTNTTEARITIDKNAAMEYGLTVAQVYSQVASDLKSDTTSTTLSIDDKDYPVVIVTTNDVQSNVNLLSDITISGTKDNESVDTSLGELASINDGVGSSAITRENGKRSLTITMSLEDGYNEGLVSRDIQSQINKINDIESSDYAIEGESATVNETMTELMKMIGLAIVLIYLIMVAQFQNLLSPFIVMFTIPLAFTGGLLALLITGNELSVISVLGFLVLSGIVVNNGIVFVDTVNQLRDEGMAKHDALIQTGKTRLRPILMTAMTTILGLSTMALGLGQGAEMMAPLAIVTIGGLIYATLMTLFIVPIFYDLFQRKERKVINVEFDTKPVTEY